MSLEVRESASQKNEHVSQELTGAPVSTLTVKQADSTITEKVDTVGANNFITLRYQQAGNESFQRLRGKDFFALLPKNRVNEVDQWMLLLLNSITCAALINFKENFAYLSHLSLENQMTLLIEAKKLANKIIDLTPINDADRDTMSSILTLIETKYQELQKIKPDFSPILPINTEKEKALEAILKADALKADQIARREDCRNKLYGIAALVGCAAPIFGMSYLFQQLLGKEAVAAFGVLLVVGAIHDIYNRTIVINLDGTPPSVCQKLRYGLAGHIGNGIQSIVERFSR